MRIRLNHQNIIAFSILTTIITKPKVHIAFFSIKWQSCNLGISLLFDYILNAHDSTVYTLIAQYQVYLICDYAFYYLFVLDIALQPWPLLVYFWEYIIVVRLVLFTETCIPEVKQHLVVYMFGTNDVSAAWFLHAIVECVKLCASWACLSKPGCKIETKGKQLFVKLKYYLFVAVLFYNLCHLANCFRVC